MEGSLMIELKVTYDIDELLEMEKQLNLNSNIPDDEYFNEEHVARRMKAFEEFMKFASENKVFEKGYVFNRADCYAEE
jgi:hypothetical protein